MKISLASLALASAVFAMGCKTTDSTETNSKVKTDAASDTVTYAGHIKLVMDQACVSCHNGTVQPTDFTTFEGVKENIDNIIKRMEETDDAKRMPLGFDALSADLVGVLKDWKEKGMPEGSGAKDMKLTFDQDIGKILKDNCTSCHAAGKEQAKSDFTSYANMDIYIYSIVSKVWDGSMPKAPAGSTNPAPYLSKLDRLALELWKLKSYPEN